MGKIDEGKATQSVAKVEMDRSLPHWVCRQAEIKKPLICLLPLAL